MSAGLWSFLPLGWRVHEKAVQIVRDEMNAIGGQEMFMPVVTPAELWQATGRYPIPELWKTNDRMGRPFVLAMTHEETVTFHAREIASYRQLPQILYHFQTKVRDEPRPRAGLIRVREFVMKDSYSFDRDEEGLDLLLAKGGYDELRARRESARAEGAYYGVGLALVVDPSGTNIGYVGLATPASERKPGRDKSGSTENVRVQWTCRAS